MYFQRAARDAIRGGPVAPEICFVEGRSNRRSTVYAAPARELIQVHAVGGGSVAREICSTERSECGDVCNCSRTERRRAPAAVARWLANPRARPRASGRAPLFLPTR